MKHTLNESARCARCHRPYPWADNECRTTRRDMARRRYGFGANEMVREMETRAALGTTPMTPSEWLERILGPILEEEGDTWS